MVKDLLNKLVNSSYQCQLYRTVELVSVHCISSEIKCISVVESFTYKLTTTLPTADSWYRKPSPLLSAAESN